MCIRLFFSVLLISPLLAEFVCIRILYACTYTYSVREVDKTAHMCVQVSCRMPKTRCDAPCLFVHSVSHSERYGVSGAFIPLMCAFVCATRVCCKQRLLNVQKIIIAYFVQLLLRCTYIQRHVVVTLGLRDAPEKITREHSLTANTHTNTHVDCVSDVM